MKVRKRALGFSFPGARSKHWSGGLEPFGWTTYGPENPPYLQGIQVTESENHPGWKHSRASTGDVGGPFSSIRRYATLTGGDASISGSASFFGGSLVQRTKYEGLCLPTGAVLEWPPYPEYSEGKLKNMGTTAIDNCKPTNIFTDLSASLAEYIQHGVPKMDIATWKRNIEAAKQAADNYLSLEFGFKPVVEDVKDVSLALTRADAAIRQYVRDSGKTVRRRYDFPHISTEEVMQFGGSTVPFTRFSSAPIDNFWGPPGKVIRVRKTDIRRWFAGAFTYHLPFDDNLRSVSEAALKAQGLISLELTPETLWNLAPWSWAIDWVFPVGSYISNLQDWSQDGLVLRYGYIMEHSKRSDTYSYWGNNSQEVGILTLTSESKKRIRSSPFGFGTSWDALSARQLSILTALGITRS